MVLSDLDEERRPSRRLAAEAMWQPAGSPVAQAALWLRSRGHLGLAAGARPAARDVSDEALGPVAGAEVPGCCTRAISRQMVSVPLPGTEGVLAEFGCRAGRASVEHHPCLGSVGRWALAPVLGSLGPVSASSQSTQAGPDP